MLSQKRYEAFYEFIQNILTSHFPSLNKVIVAELIELCKARNYIVHCLRGVADTCISVSLSDDTIDQLVRINYFNVKKEQIPSDNVMLQIDESIAKSIYNSLQSSAPQIQTISLLAQKFPIYLKPSFITVSVE